MSTHPSVEQLSAFLDQELPDADRLPLEDHLRTCDVCAAHLAELAAVDEAARSLPLEEPAGYFDDFAARVRARVGTGKPRRMLPVWSWAAAAALLLAVVTPLALRERAAQSPTAAVVREEAPAVGAPALPSAAARPQAPFQDAEAKMKKEDRALPETRERQRNEAEMHDRLQQRDRPAERAVELQKQLSQDKLESAPEPADSAPAPPAAHLAEKTADDPGALGYVVPAPAAAPARSQRQHGPRSQQFVPPPQTAAPGPVADGEFAASVAPVAADTAEGLREADVANGRDLGSARAKRADASDPGAMAGAAAGGGEGVETRLGATTSVAKPATARTGDEARRRREAFRKMVGERPDDASSDEARVGVIEEGVRAFRLEGRAEDRAQAERDGRAYLARPDALQAARVRALLKALSEPRS